MTKFTYFCNRVILGGEQRKEHTMKIFFFWSHNFWNVAKY